MLHRGPVQPGRLQYDVLSTIDTLREWADVRSMSTGLRPPAMLRKLREAVPRPTPRAQSAFESFRVKGQADRDKMFDEAIDKYIRRR